MTFFNYSTNRTVFAVGSLTKPSHVDVRESGVQVRPSQEEFDDAVRAMQDDPQSRTSH